MAEAGFEFSEHPHRRYNPLLKSWILCSPHRAKRPWQGQVEKAAVDERPKYDPKCYLCPGNLRSTGDHNPQYETTFVFQNDFSALMPTTPANETVQEGGDQGHPLLLAKSARGLCRVLCFSPRHDLTMGKMKEDDIRRVIDMWAYQYADLGKLDFINYVMTFENRGAMMGCSNPHPHGQIWAGDWVPEDPAKELDAMSEWHAARGSCLLCDYVQLETQKKERVVVENASFVLVVPFWAVWPYESLLLPKRHAASLIDLSPAERNDLASVLRRTTVRYDNLFTTDFPYSMGIHQAPTDGQAHPTFHMHFHFYPPLLRSATVKKFMVGFELLAEPQRDVTAEQSADKLRQCSEVHYTAAASS